MGKRPRFVCEDASETNAADGTKRGAPLSAESVYAAPPPDLFASAEIPTPSVRPLNVYAFDPGAGHFIGNYMTALVRYEDLAPGPIGRRFAVIDYDGGTGKFYTPIDLNDKRLLVGGGFIPRESDPRFHQQMVYAVAMETLQRFECALGRRIHWARLTKAAGANQSAGASRRLNIFPHAMCQANAFYSRDAHALLFGYFKASRTDPGSNIPGQTVFTCLSHDIIAHETTHAIVDGIRKHFMEATNVDVSAFHEAFADLAALFSHFAHKHALLDTIQKTGGELFKFQLTPETGGAGKVPTAIQAQLPKDNPLIGLAQQFGEAAGMRKALRSALGTAPNSKDIETKLEPHDRGAILVAAVFDAYFTIYTRRTADLFRIFRAGGGSLVQPDLPGPLADRLATEASRTAEQFFTICARALDYCPPVDITFGDFLRAVLTADLDLRPEDPEGVRSALIEAFRSRGIFPGDAASSSEESIFWPKVRRAEPNEPEVLPAVEGLVFGDPNGLTADEQKQNASVLNLYADKNAERLGFSRASGTIHAASFHPMFHMGQDGRLFVNMVVELVQTVEVPFDRDDPQSAMFPMRNGVTLLISQDPPGGDDKREPRVRFVIAKTHTPEREKRIRDYYISTGQTFVDGPDINSTHINFGLLHAGV